MNCILMLSIEDQYVFIKEKSKACISCVYCNVKTIMINTMVDPTRI